MGTIAIGNLISIISRIATVVAIVTVAVAILISAILANQKE